MKCHIFSLAIPARENMWHFVMFRENIFHASRKTKKYHEKRKNILLFFVLWLLFNQLLFFLSTINACFSFDKVKFTSTFENGNILCQLSQHGQEGNTLLFYNQLHSKSNPGL
jgi:hypothetical protein